MNDGFSILIPYHGQYKMVRELVSSICMFTRKIPYRITVIDDGSENADFFYGLSQHPLIDGARHEEQKGFGAAVNTGVRLTKSPWVVVLNSDCVIEEMSWLTDLHKAAADLKVGLVSARTDNPPGDNPLLKTPRIRKNIENQISDKPLPLFCALMARKLLEKVGPLKEYPYGWFEDEEYYYRMKKMGHKQGISGKAWVRHHGAATTKELWEKRPETQKIMTEDNRTRCLEDLKLLFR